MKKLCLLLVIVMLLTVFTGCGAKNEETVSVQSVAMITGAGSVGLAQRYAGVVSARSETKIETDSQKSVGEIFVEEGDNVKAGDVLFSYDMELAELNLEKAELELAQMKSAVDAKTSEKASLEKQLANASSSDQLSYTLAIAECDNAIREQNYNIALKEKEHDRLKVSLETSEYVSPIDGRIQSINAEGGGYDDYGNPLPFMTIMETGTYRVKGIINEMNAGALIEGMSIVIRSRRDSSLTWTGSISIVDWENPEQNNNNYYYDSSDSMSSSTKYPFYVELDDASGLLLGEHVYIEPDLGCAEETGLMLPEWYLFDIDTDKNTASVWAQSSKGTLEKRSVTLGTYNIDLASYEITGGLDLTDYIAYPDDTLSAGQTCVEYDESGFDTGDEYIDGSSMSYSDDSTMTTGAAMPEAVAEG